MQDIDYSTVTVIVQVWDNTYFSALLTLTVGHLQATLPLWQSAINKINDVTHPHV